MQYWISHVELKVSLRKSAKSAIYSSAGLMPTEARGNYVPEPPYLGETKDLSQPATRVDTTCWQLFRSDINTAHFLFFVADVMSNYLTTDALKNFFSTSGGPPEA